METFPCSGDFLALPGSFPNHCWLWGEKDPAQKWDRKMSLRYFASSGAPQLCTPLHRAWGRAAQADGGV